MERILVAIDQQHPQQEALTHGCSLAKRIQARLYVIFVQTRAFQNAHLARQRLELLVGYAKADGINIEYFVAEGGYEESIVSFVHNHGITLLIHEQEHAGISAMQSVRHRVSCRVEIVTPQKR